MINLKLSVVILFIFIGCATSDNSKKNVNKEDRASFHLNMANGALSEGDATEALRQIMIAENLNPKRAEIFHTKGIALFLKREPKQAIEALQKAVELKPDYSIARNTLGRFLMEEGQIDRAIIELTRAAKDPLNPESYKASTNLGILYYKRNQIQEAEKNFTEATLQSSQGSCIASYYLGHISLKNNSPERAIGFYSKATRGVCGGNFQDAHFAVGLTFEKMNNAEKARKKYLEIQELYPGSQVANKAMNRLRELP